MNRPRKKDRHLPPCVHEKHGAFYYVKRGKWQPLGKTLPAALAEYGRLFSRQEGAGLDALIDRTLIAMRARTAKPLSANTLAQYVIASRKLKKIFREFGSAAEVRQRHIFALRNGLAATPNMANRVLSFARSVFDQAAQEGIVDSNPALGVGRLQEKKRERLLSRDELSAIYLHAGPRLRVIIDLLIRTGQRINDVLAIRRADITAEGIYFKQQKTSAKVLVKSTPEIEEAVARAKTLYANIVAMTLLHNRRGKRPDYRTVKLQWDNACKAAGVADAHLHDLRSVAATSSRSQGKNATILLGHKNPAQTDRYLRDRVHKIADGPSFGHLLDKATK